MLFALQNKTAANTRQSLNNLMYKKHSDKGQVWDHMTHRIRKGALWIMHPSSHRSPFVYSNATI